jgi:serine phosphatase RsbU (regulator of sigma subunit)
MAATERTQSANKKGLAGEGEGIGRLHQRLAELEQQYAEVLSENARLRGEQTATADVLRVIAQSPADLNAVLAVIAERAARVCGAEDAMVFQREGADQVVLAAHYGDLNAAPVGTRTKVRPDYVAHRAILERRTIHVPDILAAPEAVFGAAQAMQRRSGQRTMLATPFLRDGAAIGAALIRRTEVRPFTEEQIALLETFADQAVIAIENARLFSELQERLEEQAATAEVLRVIGASPTDAQPVFNAIVEGAVRVCGAATSALWRLEDAGLVRLALHIATDLPGLPDLAPGTRADYARDRLVRERPPGRAALDGRTIQVVDGTVGPEDGYAPEWLDRVFHRQGTRTFLATPLLREGRVVGVLAARKVEAQAFSDRDIALFETFAAQAVIAMENARLFGQLQEENERKRQELERASGIQRRLLPSHVPVWPGQLEIAYRFRAAVETSGDFYDVVTAAATTPEDQAPLQIAVADVAGKGMGGALVMSLARAALRFAATSPIALSPAGTARMVSDRLHRDVGSSSFVACALATVEPPSWFGGPRLRLVNAGQVPVLRCRGGDVTELEPPGDRLPFGAMAGVDYQELVVRLRTGDVVVFSSDGLVEAPAQAQATTADDLPMPQKAGELFGFARLHQSVARWAEQAENAEGVAEGIWSDLTAWCGEESHHDDMTLLVLRVP